MIYSKKELKEAIGGKDVDVYLQEKGYRYVVVGNKSKPLYLIEDRLKLKARVFIEDVLKKDYSIEDGIVDDLIHVIVGVYESGEAINIKDLVRKDRAIVDTLLQAEILMYDYHTYNVQIKYSLLCKILEV